MHIEIRPFADGWAWFLIGTGATGREIIASSKPFITRHAAAASAQRLMLEGVHEIYDQTGEQQTGGGANQS